MPSSVTTEFERPRYFTGKLLTAEDLELEQRHHVERRRLLNRMLHGAGIVSGLGVAGGPQSVTVAPGFALDPLGREILVSEPEQLAIPACDEAVSVCVLYAEVETDRGTIRETYRARSDGRGGPRARRRARRCRARRCSHAGSPRTTQADRCSERPDHRDEQTATTPKRTAAAGPASSSRRSGIRPAPSPSGSRAWRPA